MNGIIIKIKNRLSPFQIIIMSFTGVILIGMILLILPAASRNGQFTSPECALFTATSAVCVTGLIMKDTASYWSPFGQAVILAGVAIMLLKINTTGALAGLLLVGLGCAPIYPSVIHSTPDHFGEENSQAIIGVQMASAYLGSLIAPPVFGLIANHISASLLPAYLGVILVVMVAMCEQLNRKCHA